MTASLYERIKIITRRAGSSFFYPTLALSRRDSASLGDSAGSSRQLFKSGLSRFRGRCASPMRLKEAAPHSLRNYFSLCIHETHFTHPMCEIADPSTALGMTEWSVQQIAVVEECFEDLEIRERVGVGFKPTSHMVISKNFIPLLSDLSFFHALVCDIKSLGGRQKGRCDLRGASLPFWSGGAPRFYGADL